MAIVLTRIDNRLIHGQVLESWVPHVRADFILVANDAVAASHLGRTVMEMSVPRTIGVRILPVAEAVALLRTGELAAARVALLFAGTADALRAQQLGLALTAVNLGNLHGGEGKVRYTCTICLDDSDRDNLRQLEQAGARVCAQCIPTDRERPLAALYQCPEAQG